MCYADCCRNQGGRLVRKYQKGGRLVICRSKYILVPNKEVDHVVGQLQVLRLLED